MNKENDLKELKELVKKANEGTPKAKAALDKGLQNAEEALKEIEANKRNRKT